MPSFKRYNASTEEWEPVVGNPGQDAVDILRWGTLASRPAASAAIEGVYYAVIDAPGRVDQVQGNAWVTIINAGVAGGPAGLTGATQPARFVGGTTTGAPTTGTFAVGDFVIAQDGRIWTCNGAGSPGTWLQVAPVTSSTSPSAVGTTAVGSATVAARADHVHQQQSAVRPGSALNAGVNTNARFVGHVATNGSPPSTGTFSQGDFVLDASNGRIYICQTAGTPGNWATVSPLTGVTTPVAIGTAAIGSSNSAARADHVHAQQTAVTPTGLTGTGSSARFVGSTVSGAPSTGTFAVGDFVVAGDGLIHVCTAAGSPGTWVALGFLTSTTPSALGSASAGIATSAARADHVHAMPTAGNVGAIALSVVNAKGDLLAGTADDTVTRMPVGTDGYVLIADSAQATGLNWAALTKSSVGLGNVDNTSDANKPVSTAQQAALDAKQASDSDLTAIAGLSPSNDDVIQRKSGAWTNRTPAQLKTDLALTKTDVGLANVDNTTDANKPISTATQTALDAKMGIIEAITTDSAVTGTKTIPDVTTGTQHRYVMIGNTTFTFPTAAAGKSFILALVQDATGGRLSTWPSSVKWPGGVAPTQSTGANKVDLFTFNCMDGTNWLGLLAGLDMR